MKFFKAIASVGILFLSSGVSAAEYKRGENKEQDALYDIQTGMAGMQQAAKDPALLAQLIQDMQVRLWCSVVLLASTAFFMSCRVRSHKLDAAHDVLDCFGGLSFNFLWKCLDSTSTWKFNVRPID